MIIEEVIAKVIEQSIISGGFLFLLYSIVTKQQKQMDSNTDVLREMVKTLADMKSDIEDLKKKAE